MPTSLAPERAGRHESPSIATSPRRHVSSFAIPTALDHAFRTARLPIRRHRSRHEPRRRSDPGRCRLRIKGSKSGPPPKSQFTVLDVIRPQDRPGPDPPGPVLIRLDELGNVSAHYCRPRVEISCSLEFTAVMFSCIRACVAATIDLVPTLSLSASGAALASVPGSDPFSVGVDGSDWRRVHPHLTTSASTGQCIPLDNSTGVSAPPKQQSSPSSNSSDCPGLRDPHLGVNTSSNPTRRVALRENDRRHPLPSGSSSDSMGGRLELTSPPSTAAAHPLGETQRMSAQGLGRHDQRCLLAHRGPGHIGPDGLERHARRDPSHDAHMELDGDVVYRLSADDVSASWTHKEYLRKPASTCRAPTSAIVPALWPAVLIHPASSGTRPATAWSPN